MKGISIRETTCNKGAENREDLLLLPAGDPENEENQVYSKRIVLFPSGRRASFKNSDGEDLLIVKNPEGFVELMVRFTDAGPVLYFQSAALDIKSRGDFAVDCKKFRVRAKECIDLTSKGDLVQDVHGKMETKVVEESVIKARKIEIKSTLGDVDIKANDDVHLRGERIKLNC